MELTLVHLYPDLMNLYGDRGNIIALQRRCEWRGIKLHIIPLSINEPFDDTQSDMVFIGGGQDYEQSILQDDVITKKKENIIKAIESDVVFLTICGGFQLLGHYYQTGEGKRIECLGAMNHYTVAGTKRLIGNLVFDCDLLPDIDKKVIGFENHSGKTILGDSVFPLGKVLSGYGNNGEDGFEGAYYRNVICSYSHGSLLPKNPAIADYLITQALKRKYPTFEALEPLPDNLEAIARKHLLQRLLK